jgi:hypothetical protein
MADILLNYIDEWLLLDHLFLIFLDFVLELFNPDEFAFEG